MPLCRGGDTTRVALGAVSTRMSREARAMPQSRSTTTRRAIAGATAALALASPLAATTAAQAKDPVCKHQAQELVRKAGGVVYRKSASLFACTAYYGDPVKIHRLGPWSSGFSKINFDGSTAVWTVAGPAFEGVPAARVWAANASSGKAWIKGVRPALQPVEDTDNSVVTLKANGQAVAWVTSGGALMMGVEQPDGSPADPIGAGTPAASLPASLGVAQGLATPLAPKGHRLLVGRWNNLTPAALGATLKLTAGEGDGDECGGAGPWNLTVTPIADQPVVGATWQSGWTSTSDACTGL